MALAVAMWKHGALMPDLIDIHKEASRSDFVKGCGLFYDNVSDLTFMAWVLHNGFEYVSTDRESIKRLCVVLQKPFIPQQVKNLVNGWMTAKPKPKIVQPKKKPQSTNIYVMRNSRNGYYKIGKSRNPRVRESTLQSEEPEIELLFYWPGTIGDEQQLHSTFAGCRIRGEWFALTEQDVESLRVRSVAMRGAA